MKETQKIHFLGAAGTVTGSKYLLEAKGKKILVDCGMYQGLKKLRTLNWSYLPVHAKDIDAVLLTHGHLDHVGFIPRLVKMGFRGQICGTSPSLTIAKIILLDSARIQEEDAKRANEEGFSKHELAEPLYNVEEAQKSFENMEAVPEGEWLDLFDDIKVRWQYASHIIGACFIEMDIDEKRFVFSGDLGRPHDELLYPPKKPEKADYLLLESTYGDRLHPDEDALEKLVEIIEATVQKGGSLFIPSFAVERTQTLMYILWQLKKRRLIPDIPMIMDSPMGDRVLEVFENNGDWHRKNFEEFEEMMNAFRIVKNYKETWEIVRDEQSKIVIAGSGMITGGRILTYLQFYLDKPETGVLLVGYQGEGTRGRALLEGYPEVKFRGKYVSLKAEIYSIASLSSHADQAELMDWLSDIKTAPKQVFLIHGENQARDTFRVKLETERGWKVALPELYEIFETES